MLKHNPKLNKLWRNAKKRKGEYGEVTLDMRHKSSKDFIKGFGDYIKESVKEEDSRLIDLVIN